MKRIALAVTLATVLVGCNGEVPGAGGGPTDGGRPEPGFSVDLNAILGLPPGAATDWRVTLGAGTVDPVTGIYTAPNCANAPPLPHNVTVAARLGQNEIGVFLIVDEALLALDIVCYIPSGETLCRDPRQGVEVPVGGTVQFFSKLTLTCTKRYDPVLPAGACPALDPAFAFCQL